MDPLPPFLALVSWPGLMETCHSKKVVLRRVNRTRFKFLTIVRKLFWSRNLKRQGQRETRTKDNNNVSTENKTITYHSKWIEEGLYYKQQLSIWSPSYYLYTYPIYMQVHHAKCLQCLCSFPTLLWGSQSRPLVSLIWDEWILLDSSYDWMILFIIVCILYHSYSVRIRFTSANPYIIYTYLEFPLGCMPHEACTRLGIDGLWTSMA